MDKYLILVYLIGYVGYLLYAIIELDNPFQKKSRIEYAKFVAFYMLIALFWPVILMAGIFKKILG